LAKSALQFRASDLSVKITSLAWEKSSLEKVLAKSEETAVMVSIRTDAARIRRSRAGAKPGGAPAPGRRPRSLQRPHLIP
jgi:hypothetical protein